jgi:hypothetical protein
LSVWMVARGGRKSAGAASVLGVPRIFESIGVFQLGGGNIHGHAEQI